MKTCLNGYIMSGFSNGGGGLKYTCVDSHLDTLHGGHTNGDDKLFCLVEARCGSLSAHRTFRGENLFVQCVPNNERYNHVNEDVTNMQFRSCERKH